MLRAHPLFGKAPLLAIHNSLHLPIALQGYIETMTSTTALGRFRSSGSKKKNDDERRIASSQSFAIGGRGDSSHSGINDKKFHRLEDELQHQEQHAGLLGPRRTNREIHRPQSHRIIDIFNCDGNDDHITAGDSSFFSAIEPIPTASMIRGIPPPPRIIPVSCERIHMNASPSIVFDDDIREEEVRWHRGAHQSCCRIPNDLYSATSIKHSNDYKAAAPTSSSYFEATPEASRQDCGALLPSHHLPMRCTSTVMSPHYCSSSDSDHDGLHDTSEFLQPPPAGVVTEADLCPYDVICGRDKLAFNNIGNRRFRVTVSTRVQCYLRAKRRHEKKEIITQITETMMGVAGARFLKRWNGNRETMFVPLSPKEVRNKVQHAIRDMAAMTTKNKPNPEKISGTNRR